MQAPGSAGPGQRGQAAVTVPAGQTAAAADTLPLPRLPRQRAGEPPQYADVQHPGGPVEWLMSRLIRKLSWSRLADPRIALGVSGTGLLLGMLVGATAPNVATSSVRLPLSSLLPSLSQHGGVAMVMLYAGDVLACLGLAGMLWAHSQGWTPDPRRLLLLSGIVVAVMVSITPVGSSDTGSYAAYGHIAVQGGNPYTNTPLGWGDTGYSNAVGTVWKSQPSVYGPVATLLQAFAAWIGGPNVVLTVWVLMILNGAVFIGIGYLLLKTSDDPVRATLFWAANPVLIQQLVSGGHLDTLVAGVAICAIQVARRVSGVRGDVLIGVLVGLACGVKVNAVLIALGLGWVLLRRREWARVARVTAAAAATVVAEYSYYGLSALHPLVGAANDVIFPSPWRVVQMSGEALGLPADVVTKAIGVLWPVAMLALAWVINRRISSDQPREVVAPFALTFAWILAAPWVFAWYTALAWVTLTQVPRNRMTRWLAIVTMVLALWLSNGGHGRGVLW